MPPQSIFQKKKKGLLIVVQTKGELREFMAPGSRALGPLLLQGEKVVTDVQREQIYAESDL